MTRTTESSPDLGRTCPIQRLGRYRGGRYLKHRPPPVGISEYRPPRSSRGRRRARRRAAARRGLGHLPLREHPEVVQRRRVRPPSAMCPTRYAASSLAPSDATSLPRGMACHLMPPQTRRRSARPAQARTGGLVEPPHASGKGELAVAALGQGPGRPALASRARRWRGRARSFLQFPTPCILFSLSFFQLVSLLLLGD